MRWCVFVAVALASLVSGGACSAPQAPEEPEAAVGSAPADPAATPEPEGPAPLVAEEFAEIWKPWKGDLDGIVEDRVLRILVTYNSTFYFADRGRQGGVTYELGRLLEEELNERFGTGALRIDVVFIPVTRDRLLPALVEGHGDIAASNLTITDERRQRVAFSEPLGQDGKEIVVTGPGAPPVTRLEDLSGLEVYVRASSSFAESLRALNASFAERGLRPVEIVPVDEHLETEDILEMANAGVYPVTVADDHMVDLWTQVLGELRAHPEVAVRTGTRIAWAMRKENPQLKSFVDEFVREHRAGTLIGNILIKRYLENTRWIRNPEHEGGGERFLRMVGLFQRYASQYDLDYLLVAAQAYQESGLDQGKRSPAGAIGVMQLRPSTAGGKNVGIPDIHVLEDNVHAGVKYLRFIMDRYFGDEDMDDLDRYFFTFASYNAGPARVAGLRRDAERMGLDPNVWRGSVEVVAAREIGRETVQYVANIYKYYLAYRLIEERYAEKSAAKARSLDELAGDAAELP